jgi:hypothetical protein
MNRKRADTANFMRLNFELERDDNPRLYDDLARFNKGVKRLNRLRTLAQDGLLVQCMPVGVFALAEGNGNQQAASRDGASVNQEGQTTGLAQLFEDPILE